MRNKAAEKAKHVHQQQQAQQQQGQQEQQLQSQIQPSQSGSVSVISHAPATAGSHASVAAPNAYSISGILGIPVHHPDANGNSIKRKQSHEG